MASSKTDFKRFASKYQNERIVIDGIRFVSKLEAKVYIHLKELRVLGVLTELELQPRYLLTDAKILFIPDFRTVSADGETRAIEAKGAETDVYKIKKRLWAAYGPYPLDVYKYSSGGFRLYETIIPGEKYVAPKRKRRKSKKAKGSKADKGTDSAG